MIEALAAELRSGRAALSLVSLRLAEAAGLLPAGSCARIAQRGDASEAGRELGERTQGALPPWPLPRRVRGRAAHSLLRGPPPEPDAAPSWPGGEPLRERGAAGFAFALCAAAEELFALRLGEHRRRSAGLYYTPPAVAAEVVSLALRHGSSRSPARVLDPCAGAGAFLCAAAAAAPGAELFGVDLHAEALRAARAALALAGTRASLRRADSLRAALLPADLVVGNPPYGHVADPAGRAFLLRRLPALRGGEIDRYAAFLLRSLELLRPGGTAALLVPDTWMTNARSGPLRQAVLDAAEVAAVCDLGKPFAAAKDTRVQAVVLVRRTAARRAPRAAHVLRGRERLADAPQVELRAGARAGWQIYRSAAERRLCSAIEAAAVPISALCAVGYGLRTGDNPRFVARRTPQPGEVALAERQLGRPRVCVQRIRTNSSAPHARWLEAAPVPPELVCLDSLSTLSCDDGDRLWALLALLGSVALQRYHRLRTTDVNVKPAVLRDLPAPRGLLEPGAAAALAALARARAAQAAAAAPDPALAPDLERAMDAAVYRLFALDEAEVIEAERGFWGPRFPVEFSRLAPECQAPRVA